MTTITYDDPFFSTREMRPPSTMQQLLSYLVSQKSSSISMALETRTSSHGLTDEEVTRGKNIADTMYAHTATGTVAGDPDRTSISHEPHELCEPEKTMVKLLASSADDELYGSDVDFEMLDWESYSQPKERKKGSFEVTLRYAGRGKPLVDPDPWT